MKAIKIIAAAGLLLGATSVMAQDAETQTKSAGGTFTFVVPEFFEISCDESNATVSDPEQMMVPTVNDLSGAVATIECEVESKSNSWFLTLAADNAGLMPKTKNKDGQDVTSNDVLMLNDGSETYEGRLGMWVEFTEANTPDVDIGTLDNRTFGINTALITNSTPTGVGGAIKPDDFESRKEWNLATVLDDGATRFGARHTSNGNNMGAKFKLEIKAAFVAPTSIINSSAGTYQEHINIFVSTEAI